MTWATSEQALERLVMDTPQFYRATATMNAASAALCALVTARGVSLSALAFQQPEMSAKLVGLIAGGSAFYFFRQGLLIAGDVGQNLQFSRSAGAQRKTYLTKRGNLRRQLLLRERAGAIEVRPYADLADIPDGAYGAVNAVPEPHHAERQGDKILYGVSTNAGGQNLYVTKATHSYFRPTQGRGPFFLISQRVDDHLDAKFLFPPFGGEPGQRYRRPAKERFDLAGQPNVAPAPQRG